MNKSGWRNLCFDLNFEIKWINFQGPLWLQPGALVHCTICTAYTATPLDCCGTVYHILVTSIDIKHHDQWSKNCPRKINMFLERHWKFPWSAIDSVNIMMPKHSAIVSKISRGRASQELKHNHTQFVSNALRIWKPMQIQQGRCNVIKALQAKNQTMNVPDVTTWNNLVGHGNQCHPGWRSDDFRAPRQQFVWTPGQGVTATTSSRGRPCYATGHPIHVSLRCMYIVINAVLLKILLYIAISSLVLLRYRTILGHERFFYS